MACLMLIFPITSVAQTNQASNTKDIKPLNDEPVPEIYLTESELQILNQYIENNFDGEEKTEAYNILNKVLGEDLKIDFVELSNSLKDYGYDPIPEELLNSVTTKNELNQLIQEYWDFSKYLFEGLLNKIIDLIKNRLGWLYDLYDEGRNLFVEGVNLATNFADKLQNIDIAILFVKIVNVLITVPVTYFSTTINKLFKSDFDGFIESVENFTSSFTNDFIQFINNLAALIGPNFQPLKNYLYSVSDYIGWIINDKPWEDRIEVTGSVTIIGIPVSNIEIECKGEKYTTDSSGQFSFYIYPDDTSDDSFPKNSYYGMHNCQISVYTNGEFSKQTPKLFSYVFSSGKINWNFNIINSKDKTREFLFMKIFENLFERIQIFLLNFLIQHPYFS